MDLHELSGGCHCGNIRFKLTLTGALAQRHPRACDCDFCRTHGASYISDPQGTLQIDVADESLLQKYKQGSGIADFLICKACGVLVGVSYQEGGRIYATVNSKAIDAGAQFAQETPVSPKLLATSKKLERWQENWFHDVVLNVNRRIAD